MSDPNLDALFLSAADEVHTARPEQCVQEFALKNSKVYFSVLDAFADPLFLGQCGLHQIAV